MTNATEVHSPKYVDTARILVHPGPELGHALERFLHPDLARSLGARALNLVSENTMPVYDVPFERAGVDSVVTGVSVGELAVIGRRLAERQRTIRPQLSSEVTLGKLNPPAGREREGTGLDMRFMIILNELTQRALARTTFVDSKAGGLYVHFGISRPNMQEGHKLPDARDRLGELLQQNPQYVDALYIHSDVLHP
ncbi:hypothetical protein H7142_02650 [Candidatus Saccharibacteria bacterium]|nr:hypothetical protein [Candidatus Saccharibacteria bacterium]